MPVTYPFANIRRAFGIVDDVAGGTSYENLATPTVVPDASIWWPVTGGSLDRGLTRIDRSNEARGSRSVATPLPFRAAPTMTIPAPAYRSVVEKAMRKLLGGTDTVTGSATAGYLHTISELGFGTTQLPTVCAQLVRDDLNHKMSGGYFNSVTLDFPLDGEGTCSSTIMGLYHANYSSTPPTATFSDVNDILLLRDAAMLIDGAVTPIPNLSGVSLTFNNNINVEFFGGHNIATATVGASPLLRKLWFPAYYKLGAQLDISGSITFTNVNTAQEIATDFGQIQKFILTFTGGAIPGSTGPINEAIQIVISAAMLTADSPGAGDLTARGDMNYSVNFGGFYSTVDSQDMSFSSLNGISAAIA